MTWLKPTLWFHNYPEYLEWHGVQSILNFADRIHCIQQPPFDSQLLLLISKRLEIIQLCFLVFLNSRKVLWVASYYCKYPSSSLSFSKTLFLWLFLSLKCLSLFCLHLFIPSVYNDSPGKSTGVGCHFLLQLWSLSLIFQILSLHSLLPINHTNHCFFSMMAKLLERCPIYDFFFQMSLMHCLCKSVHPLLHG